MENFLTTNELAKILGISRIAIFKKIKNGTIKAQKIGRNFIIYKKDIGDILGKELREEQKKIIDSAVEKTIKQYGEALEMLGKE